MGPALFLAIVVVVIAGWALGRQGAGGAMPEPKGRGPGKPECRWSETGAQKGRFVEYICDACGVTAYSHTGKPPTICKRNLQGSS